jgi:hypothetical protein
VTADFMTEIAQTGAAVLDSVEALLSRFIVYPSDYARLAHTLWIAHCWFMSCWETAPRIAFLSPEPGSGKTRALEVTAFLVPRAVHSVNNTPAYLFRKIGDPKGLPTILYDEIDTVFGVKGRDNEAVRGMLNAGHRRGATAGRCTIYGNNIYTEELPAYCAVALAGLNDLPDTLMSRSIIVRMRRRAPGESIEPWRERIHGPQASEVRERLETWAERNAATVTAPWPVMPNGIEDRNADIWEPLIAVADLDGGDWPNRARRSAVALVAQSRCNRPSLGLMLLRDLHTLYAGSVTETLPTEQIIAQLTDMEMSPWDDVEGKPLDARRLARLLDNYGVKPRNIRVPARVVKGYHVADLRDPWARYVGA